MTFYAFRLLSPEVQLYWVRKHGTYLAQRWEETPVNLTSMRCTRVRGFSMREGE